MTPQAFFRALALGSLMASFVIVLASAPAVAQETYYDNNGVVSGPDLFETDGFRPVWEQEQEIAARRARAKAAAQARAAAQAKARQASLQPPPKPLSEQTTRFDSWALTCQEFAAGKGRRKVCTAALRAPDAQTGRLVVLWNVQRLAKGRLRAVIQTPTGVQVPAGVELQLGATVHKFVYESCSPDGCAAVGPLDNNLVKEITAAPEAVFTVRARDGSTVTFKSPVAGFDKALPGVRS